MCMNTSNLNPCHPICSTASRQRPSKGLNIRIHRLYRKRRIVKEGRETVRAGVTKREMEIKNLKLFMENQSVIEENEKLRKKALQLHQENNALLSQLQKVSHSYNHLAREKNNNSSNKCLKIYIPM